MEDAETVLARIPEFPKKKQKKTKTKTRIRMILGISIGLVILSVFFGLLHYYKNTLKEGTASPSGGSWVGNNLLAPMASGLQPIFDKTLRLSAAAQPLFDELIMRSKPSEASYLETSNTNGTLENKETKLAALSETNSETNNVDTTAETNEPKGEPEENAAASSK